MTNKKIVNGGMKRAEKILVDNVETSIASQRRCWNGRSWTATRSTHHPGDALPRVTGTGRRNLRPTPDQEMNGLESVERSYTSEMIRKGIHLASLSIPSSTRSSRGTPHW